MLYPMKTTKFLFCFLFITGILSFILSNELEAQSMHMEDVVYLKDGSEIRGWIVEQVPNEYLKIELIGGSILVYRMEDVERIKKEPTRYKTIVRKVNRKKLPVMYRERGAYNFVTTSFMFNEGRWGPRLDVSLLYRMGFRFNQYVGVGVGTGIEGYQGGAIVPFMAEVTGDAFKRRVTPFYLAQIGYGYGAATGWETTDFKGGLLMQYAIGAKLHTRSRAEWTVSLGYKYQDVEETIEQWDWRGSRPTRIVRDRSIRGLALQFSIGF